MDKIKRFIECLVPSTTCNLDCAYCYITQYNSIEGKSCDYIKGKACNFEYSPEHIGKALSRERLGGTCYISICAAGETLIPKEITDIIFHILEEGHYVNITTNGTITKRFNEIVNLPTELLSRLHFSFSFHYLDLLRTDNLETFFANINTVKNAGCSFIVQFNMYDEYIPHLETIKNLCIERVGAAPQIAATRKLGKEIELLTELTPQEYKDLGNDFQSPLFDFTMKNFLVKRTEFCYAGDWAFVLNLSNGIAKKCYDANDSAQNIFEDITKPIDFIAIGSNCRACYCVNSSHFMSWGVIPDLETPSYADLRNRKCKDGSEWIPPKMKAFLSQKLADNNEEYDEQQKRRATRLSKQTLAKRAIRKLKRIAKKILS